MIIEKQLAFSEDEFERRLQTIRKASADRGIDALLLFSPSNIFYLSGFFSVNLWDFNCLIVPSTGDPVLVVREFETGCFLVSCRMQNPWTYPPEGSSTAAVIDALHQLGCGQDRLGLEMSRHLDTKSYMALRDGLSANAFCDVTNIVDEARTIKSVQEIEYLRRAATITDIGMEAAIAAVHESALDSDVAAEANRSLLAEGSDFMCINPIIAAARSTGLAHTTVSGIRLNVGDPVFIELGACVRRYTAPLMRTIVVGQASAELMELADYSSRVLDALIRTMKPGVRACEVADAGRRALAPIESRVFFHYVWGYSVGIGFPPSWLEETNFFIQSNNLRELQAGMVFHLPVMLRVLGQFGAGFSESVMITETGVEVLTKAPRKLGVA